MTWRCAPLPLPLLLSVYSRSVVDPHTDVRQRGQNKVLFSMDSRLTLLGHLAFRSVSHPANGSLIGTEVHDRPFTADELLASRVVLPSTDTHTCSAGKHGERSHLACPVWVTRCHRTPPPLFLSFLFLRAPTSATRSSPHVKTDRLHEACFSWWLPWLRSQSVGKHCTVSVVAAGRMCSFMFTHQNKEQNKIK